MTASSANNPANRPVVRSLDKFIKQASPRARLLASVWMLFVLLVAFGIHGSSTGVTAGWWMPEKPYTACLLGLSPEAEHKPSGMDFKGRQTYLMATPRLVRWDELIIFTPYALSQLAQQPRFPVINSSIGNGQNMLVVPHAPVWHIVTLARPATWGFFFLGAQRGVAWFWWFQVCACFTALFLLLEIAFKGDWKLAAFGAFLFGSSAYVICWSQWPAHVTFFAALACLATYHLCASTSRRTLVVCALLLGLSLPGFIMIMYPPWQVALAYFALVLFAALFIRDKLYLSLKNQLSLRLAFFGLAVALAAGLTLAWLAACLPDLKVMSNTIYPGRRVSVGGDYSFAMLFKGVYNVVTTEVEYPAFKNQSEAASFYYLFPAVLLALPLMPRLWRKLGVIGWAMIAYIIAMLFFLLVGVPEQIARLTLISYIPSYRADLTIGLASIILSLYIFKLLRQPLEIGSRRWRRWTPAIVSAAVALLFVCHSRFLLRATGDFPTPQFGWRMALLMGVIAYFLLAGRSKMFALCMVTLQLATTLTFNPLSTNLDHLYNSELAQEITRINQHSSERPFWIAYGGTFPEVLVEILGGRSLAGIHWPPQLGIWRALDPDGQYEPFYNRYAEVQFDYTNDDHLVSFSNANEGSLTVKVSPTNSTLKTLGTRYVLLMGDTQKQVDTSRLNLVSRSLFDNFSIYEIP
jgi:hypothetical protein